MFEREPLPILFNNNYNVYQMLKEAWNNYFTTGKIAMCLRPIISASWERCKQQGMNPAKSVIPLPFNRIVLEQRLEKEEWLISSVNSYLTYLFEPLKRDGFIFAICDASGLILKLEGDPKILSKSEQYNVCQGSDWSEESAGTNAIGTAIKERRPLQVFAAEHFHQTLHDWACSAAPIIHPITGEIIGVFNLTCEWKRIKPNILTFVILFAETIKNKLLQEQMSKDLLIIDTFSDFITKYPSDGILAIDKNERIIKANIVASEILNISLEKLNGCFLGKNYDYKYSASNKEDKKVFLPMHNCYVEEKSILRNNEQEIGKILILKARAKHFSYPGDNRFYTFQACVIGLPIMLLITI